MSVWENETGGTEGSSSGISFHVMMSFPPIRCGRCGPPKKDEENAVVYLQT